MADAEKAARQEVTRFDREFLRSALALAAKPDIDHFLYICDTPIAADDLRRKQAKKKLVYAVTAEPIAAELHAKKLRALVIPAYDYSRVERVKVALVSALAQGAFKEGDLVLCMTGRVGLAPDTLMQMRIGGSLEDRVAI